MDGYLLLLPKHLHHNYACTSSCCIICNQSCGQILVKIKHKHRIMAAEVWHHVADKITPNERIHVQIDGRHISVLSLGGKLYCLDSHCFHGGGPLTIGNIEEIDGKSCLDCPWHHYKVTIDGGEKLYESTKLDPATRKLQPAGWKSVGQRQRVHRVEQRDNGIFVLLDESPNDHLKDCDKYARGPSSASLLSPDSIRSSAAGGHPPPAAGGTTAAGGGPPTTAGGAGPPPLPHGYAGKPSGQIFQDMHRAGGAGGAGK